MKRKPPGYMRSTAGGLAPLPDSTLEATEEEDPMCTEEPFNLLKSRVFNWQNSHAPHVPVRPVHIC